MSNIELDYDTDRIVNSVTLSLRQGGNAASDATDTTYGPFTKPASVSAYGSRSVEATVHLPPFTGNPTTTLASIANLMMAPDPSLQPLGATLPIRTPADSMHAFLDLETYVQVRLAVRGLISPMWVDSITHEIWSEQGRGGWIMNLGFRKLGGVAPSVASSSPSSKANGVLVRGDDAGITWRTGWAQFNNTDNALLYVRSGNVHTLGGALQYTGSTADSLTGVITIATLPAAVIPPNAVVNVHVNTNDGQVLRCIVDNVRRIRVQKVPTGTATIASGIYFTFCAVWIAG